MNNHHTFISTLNEQSCVKMRDIELDLITPFFDERLVEIWRSNYK